MPGAEELIGQTVQKICDPCKVVFSVTVRSPDLKPEHCVFCGGFTRDPKDAQVKLNLPVEVPQS